MSNLDMSIIGKRAYYTLRGLYDWQAQRESLLEDEVVTIVGYTENTLKINNLEQHDVVIVKCEDIRFNTFVNTYMDGENGEFLVGISQLDIIEEE